MKVDEYKRRKKEEEELLQMQQEMYEREQRERQQQISAREIARFRNRVKPQYQIHKNNLNRFYFCILELNTNQK